MSSVHRYRCPKRLCEPYSKTAGIFQVRTLVGVFAADSQALKDYVTTLHQLSSKLVAAHNQLTSAYQDLAKHLKAYKNIVSGE